MPLPPDIIPFVQQNFSPDEQAEVIALLENAKTHASITPEPRLLRCALMASQGKLKDLRHYTGLLAIDYRDVIMAGEYIDMNGEPVQRWDLSKPFDLAKP